MHVPCWRSILPLLLPMVPARPFSCPAAPAAPYTSLLQTPAAPVCSLSVPKLSKDTALHCVER